MAAPLKGVKVLELAGLAPVPLAGMILADFGASVTRIDRVQSPGFLQADMLARGKRSVAIDLKGPEGGAVFRNLAANCDVLVEPFRPGVMEKLGLGPKVLLKDNPRLIYARLTGFGQDGLLHKKAGHDINYVALSGMLSMLGRRNEKPVPPLNLLADFAGGSLMCTLGILLALFERSKSGHGQIVDNSMVNGTSYLSSFVHKTFDMIWSGPRGKNLLDTGAPFYDTYETADGEYMSVGALEPQFYNHLIKGLGLEETFMNQMDVSMWEKMRAKFTEVFLSKSRQEWCDIFEDLDACVFPVLSLHEAAKHPHNVASGLFLDRSNGDEEGGLFEPAPAPKLSRTPGRVTSTVQPKIGQHTREVLLENGLSQEKIDELEKDGVILCKTLQSSL